MRVCVCVCIVLMVLELGSSFTIYDDLPKILGLIFEEDIWGYYKYIQLYQWLLTQENW